MDILIKKIERKIEWILESITLWIETKNETIPEPWDESQGESALLMWELMVTDPIIDMVIYKYTSTFEAPIITIILIFFLFLIFFECSYFLCIFIDLNDEDTIEDWEESIFFLFFIFLFFYFIIYFHYPQTQEILSSLVGFLIIFFFSELNDDDCFDEDFIEDFSTEEDFLDDDDDIPGCEVEEAYEEDWLEDVMQYLIPQLNERMSRLLPEMSFIFLFVFLGNIEGLI